MARLNDKAPPIPTGGRIDHSKSGGLRSGATDAGEEEAILLNNAIKKKKITVPQAPKSPTSIRATLAKTLSFLVGRGSHVPVEDVPEEDDAEGEEEGREEDMTEGNIAGAEKDMNSRAENALPSPYSQSTDARFDDPHTVLPKLDVGSSSVPPPTRALRSNSTRPPKSDQRPVSKPVVQLRNGAKNKQMAPKVNSKRKHSEVRADPYDIPTDGSADEIDHNVETSVKKAKKAAHRKPPIVLPRITRAASRKMPPSSVLRTVEDVEQAQSNQSIPAKRTRGRASKTNTAVPQAAVEPKVYQSKKQVRDNHSLAPNELSEDDGQRDGSQLLAVVDHAQEEAQGQEEEAADEGLTNVLLNPSPVKTRARKSKNAPKQVSNQGSDQAPSGSQSNEITARKRTPIPPSSREIHDYDDDIDDESLDGSIKDDNDPEDEDSEEIGTILKVGELKKMCRIAEHVGKSWNESTKRLDQVEKHAEPTSDLGRSLFYALQELIGLYENEDPESDEDHTSIETTVSNLQGDVDLVFANVLQKPMRDEQSQEVLKDLFFCVLPKLIRTIHAAARRYTLDEKVEQFAIKEMLKLAKMLKVLAEGALYHQSRRREFGTQVIRKSTYHFSRPTRSNESQIRALCSFFESMLAAKRKAKRREENKRIKFEQEKERQKLEEMKARAAQKKMEEWEREVKERLRRIWNDPITGSVYKAKVMAEQAKQRQSSSRMRGQPRRATTPLPDDAMSYDDPKEDIGPLNYNDDVTMAEEEAEEEYEEDDPELERVSVFEKNNNRQEQGPLPFSNKEQEQFIDFMRHNNDEFKYSRIANVLGRSMDDIMAAAQDLQGVMDRAHEVGEMNGEGDEWTFRIWNRTAQEQQQ